MPTIPLRAGTFRLPAGVTTHLGAITVTCTGTDNTGAATLTITDPTGVVFFHADSVTAGFSAQLGGVQANALTPGLWTITLTGNWTGTLTTS